MCTTDWFFHGRKDWWKNLALESLNLWKSNVSDFMCKEVFINHLYTSDIICFTFHLLVIFIQTQVDEVVFWCFINKYAQKEWKLIIRAGLN